MKLKKSLFMMSVVCMSLLFGGCSSQSDNNGTTPTPEADKAQTTVVEVKSFEQNPIVTMNIKDYGTVTLELYPDKAPNTVNNFVTLASQGFYDGLTFHRIIDGFMVQGGDPEGTGMGGPDYSIPGEFAINGHKANDLTHSKGVISMARTQIPDSAGSQFFIMGADNTGLDGQYAAFGEVISGIEIIDQIQKVETIEKGTLDKPVEPVVIESVTVDTHGEAIPTVVKVEK